MLLLITASLEKLLPTPGPAPAHLQKDAEEADIELERREQAAGPEAQEAELRELTQIYVDRGLGYELARRVAEELTAKDVIRAHGENLRHGYLVDSSGWFNFSIQATAGGAYKPFTSNQALLTQYGMIAVC